jgi:hypothetical protein
MIDAVLLFKEEKSFLTSADMLNIEKGQKGNYWIKMLVSFIRTAAKVIADTVGKYEPFMQIKTDLNMRRRAPYILRGIINSRWQRRVAVLNKSCSFYFMGGGDDKIIIGISTDTKRRHPDRKK